MSRKGFAAFMMAATLGAQATEKPKSNKKVCPCCNCEFIPRKGKTESGQEWETQMCDFCMKMKSTSTGL